MMRLSDSVVLSACAFLLPSAILLHSLSAKTSMLQPSLNIFPLILDETYSNMSW